MPKDPDSLRCSGNAQQLPAHETSPLHKNSTAGEFVRMKSTLAWDGNGRSSTHITSTHIQETCCDAGSKRLIDREDDAVPYRLNLSQQLDGL
ncbi:hypothetical protein [Limnohabitans sp. T6-5]|uniref:hypothetical protein n=1 Tax=Limnohabitans sp. T6-5 TaxID=1100724 RepID=UPI0011B24837|nr:hypothetical protein [Limnohabitans sp. T6-5]